MFRLFVVGCLLLVAQALRAQDSAAVTKERPTWELTPYRIELCVIVEPAARLSSQLEAQLAVQLTSSAQAAQDGLWQVSSNQKHAAARSRLLRELPIADPSAAVETEKGIDKVIFIAVRDQAGQFQITAREWDTMTRLWNIPVKRETAQVGRIAAESLTAVQDAFGPLARVDESDKGNIVLRLRGGSLPRRDGTYLIPDRRTVYRPVIVRTDKAGTPQIETSTVIPWAYFVPQTTPGATAVRAVVKCNFQRAVGKSVIPDYHALQLRLAVGLARSSDPIRLQIVDEESTGQPLEGVTIRSRDLAAGSGEKFSTQGITGRDGRLAISGSGPIWLEVLASGEPLEARPLIPGLQSEWQISVPNDRKRLQLAASLDELHDDLLDLEIRTAVLGIRLQQSVQARDLTGTARLLQEIRTVGGNPRLPARLAELEKQVAATDEATRARLQPSLTKAQEFLAKVKDGLEKADKLLGN
jgi:hypothetical protein